MLAMWGWCRSTRGEEPAKYVRLETRQQSLEATLRAHELPVCGPWSQVGPFDALVRKTQPPDENSALDARYATLGGGKAGWRTVPAYLDGYANTVDVADIDAAALAKKASVYLRRSIVAPRAAVLRVFLGCDTTFWLSLNGKQVFYNGAATELQPGSDLVELPLVAGDNVLLLKLGLTHPNVRFFFLPDWGEPLTEALVARLAADFPSSRTPERGYRQRARRKSSFAEDRYYRLVELPAPQGDVIEGGGLGFLPDGRLAVATRRGFVYLVDEPGSDDPSRMKFTRFAEGLHEPMGLGIVDGKVTVVNRGEVTQLSDTDGDGLADRQTCLTNGWGVTGNYHEYAYGLPADPAGNLYVALNLTFAAGGPSADVPYRGCVVRVAPGGRLEPVACGLRSPNGIGRNAEGEIFVTDNQGDWVGACPLYHVRPGRYFGHPASQRWYASLVGAQPLTAPDALPPRTLPAVWFPYEELCQSATDIVCDTTRGRFGPFGGQLFVGEMTKGLVARVQLEQVDGQYQGACYLFRRACGAANRLAFGPDGKLYLARVNRGWGGGGLGDGLARIVPTGAVPLEILAMSARPDGFELSFTKPLAKGVGQRPEDYHLDQYTYHHWKTYGSPPIEQQEFAIQAVEVAADRRSVRVRVPGLKPRKVCHVRLSDFTADDGDELLHADAWYTLNVIPRD